MKVLFFYYLHFLFSLSFQTSHPPLIDSLSKRDNQTDKDTGSTPDDNNSVCTKGTSVGSFLIQTPNRSSIFVVGSHGLIKWKYTSPVKQLPKFLDIKIQLIQEGVPYTWSKSVVQNLNISDGATAYNWTVQPLNDGLYKLRLIPDGKETFNVGSDKMPCFSDGEALVSIIYSFLFLFFYKTFVRLLISKNSQRILDNLKL
jgi:hypothetical protein